MHDHPSTDLADLCGLGVAVGHDQITTGSLHTCEDLVQRLPLPDEGAEPVTSEAHAVEVRRAIPAPDKKIKTQLVEMLFEGVCLPYCRHPCSTACVQAPSGGL